MTSEYTSGVDGVSAQRTAALRSYNSSWLLRYLQRPPKGSDGQQRCVSSTSPSGHHLAAAPIELAIGVHMRINDGV